MNRLKRAIKRKKYYRCGACYVFGNVSGMAFRIAGRARKTSFVHQIFPSAKEMCEISRTPNTNSFFFSSSFLARVAETFVLRIGDFFPGNGCVIFGQRINWKKKQSLTRYADTARSASLLHFKTRYFTINPVCCSCDCYQMFPSDAQFTFRNSIAPLFTFGRTVFPAKCI